MIKFCNYLILYYFLDEDKNFCLEERNDIEQHNNLEISEGIQIIKNLLKILKLYDWLNLIKFVRYFIKFINCRKFNQIQYN